MCVCVCKLEKRNEGNEMRDTSERERYSSFSLVLVILYASNLSKRRVDVKGGAGAGESPVAISM